MCRTSSLEKDTPAFLRCVPFPLDRRWWGSERSSPTHATLVCWLFWALGNWKTWHARRDFCLFHFYRKAGHTFPVWKMSSLYQDEEKNFYTKVQQANAKINLYKATQITLILRLLLYNHTYPLFVSILFSNHLQLSSVLSSIFPHLHILMFFV